MRQFALTGLLILSGALHAQAPTQYAAVSDSGEVAVATVNSYATQAALDAVAKGGNAVDAAVAAALTLGVADPHNSGIGGGAFIVIRWADGSLQAIDGREMAPALAHPDLYVRNGRVDTGLSKSGALASGIPGSLAAFDYLLQKGGKRSLAQLLLPAAELAEQGFLADRVLAARVGWIASQLPQFPELARVLTRNGQPINAGDRVVQPDLAKTYRAIAAEGIDYFYRGEFAGAVGNWMQQNDGIIRAEDFHNYRLRFREPMLSQYRGYEVVGFPPPSSGGVHVAQILNILAYFELAELSEVQRYHVIAEAMKLAFADRAYWLGDPDFVDVPKGLASADYGVELAAKISLARATPVPGHNTPPDVQTDLFDKHTTHIAAADKAGNWVAITTTLNTSFGSKVIVPGTGVILNNQMDDFSSQPNVPNAYGLIGAQANRIEAGKRPLSSMSPTILLRDGKPVATLGAAGGPTIITQVVQGVINLVDLQLELPAAIARTRIHHQWHPDRLVIEANADAELKAALTALGHQLGERGGLGSTQAIALDKAGNLVPLTEPRIVQQNRAR